MQMVAELTHNWSAYRSRGCRCNVCCGANTARTAVERADRKARLHNDPESIDIEHGSHHTYKHWGCRCLECSAAQSVENRVRYENRKARLAADPTIVEHGRATIYASWGCRCLECTQAATVAAKSARSRRNL